MLAPLIIHDERNRPGQQEVVVMLNDFSFTPPEEILAGLKKGGNMPKMARKAAPMAPMTGMAQAAAAADLNDVKYDAFLANDRTLADPEIIKVEPGTVVLLRVINGSSMSNYHLDLGRLKGELIAVDGFAIVPVSGRSFPITTAQRLDIRVAVPPRAGGSPGARCAGRRAASDWYRAGCRLGGGCRHPQYGRHGIGRPHARP